MLFPLLSVSDKEEKDLNKLMFGGNWAAFV
jgi:hypothetical protein